MDRVAPSAASPEAMAFHASIVLLHRAAAAFPHTDIKTACDTRGVTPLHLLAERIRAQVYAVLLPLCQAADPADWAETERRLMRSDITHLRHHLVLEVSLLRHTQATGWRKAITWTQLQVARYQARQHSTLKVSYDN